MNLRIGQGYDIHPIAQNRILFLGGVEIPSPEKGGLLGHSDADVLLHAVIDAVLGALALGDIGQWFPDTAEKWRGADSKKLLQFVLQDPRVKPWKLVNLDCSIIAQVPKLAPYIGAIRASLASLFNADVGCISVKAKTNEHLDAVGRKEAMMAQAVLLLNHE